MPLRFFDDVLMEDLPLKAPKRILDRFAIVKSDFSHQHQPPTSPASISTLLACGLLSVTSGAGIRRPKHVSLPFRQILRLFSTIGILDHLLFREHCRRGNGDFVPCDGC